MNKFLKFTTIFIFSFLIVGLFWIESAYASDSAFYQSSNYSETLTSPILSLTTEADDIVKVSATGSTFHSTERRIYFNYNSVVKNQTYTSVPGLIPFALQYTETPGAGTHNITITTTGGDLRYWSIIAEIISPSTGGAVSFNDLTDVPTTISGYGITDFNSLGDARWFTLPSQTGNTGKYLTTDGTDTSWGIFTGEITGGIAWGAITGDIADQTDLSNELLLLTNNPMVVYIIELIFLIGLFGLSFWGAYYIIKRTL